MRSLNLVFFGAIICSFFVAGCNGGANITQEWHQFHADGPSLGGKLVNSSVALQPNWTTDIQASNNSSPVVSESGSVYVGSAVEGELVAVNSDGTVNWRTSLSPERTYVSSPAVGSDGNIYIISTERAEEELSSTLHKVDPSGNILWSAQLPEGGFTTASPKVWASPREEYIFLNASIGAPHLLVYDDEMNLVHQEQISTNCRVTGSSPIIDSIVDFISDLWEAWTNIPADFDTSGLEVDEWLHPTVAVVDFETLTSPDQPIIVFVGSCGVAVYRWEPPDDLSFMWLHTLSNDGLRTSSPAVVGGGVVVVGTEQKSVVALDVLTGSRLWEFKADEEIVPIPASLLRQIYAASRTTLYMIDSNGDLVESHQISGPNYTAPAVSATHVYVASTGGMHSFSLDMKDFALDGHFEGWLSSISIGSDGTVYAVNEEGELWAYPGR